MRNINKKGYKWEAIGIGSACCNMTKESDCTQSSANTKKCMDKPVIVSPLWVLASLENYTVFVK